MIKQVYISTHFGVIYERLLDAEAFALIHNNFTRGRLGCKALLRVFPLADSRTVFHNPAKPQARGVKPKTL